ncbi:hypothetical protein DICVIV_13148 [Dictyocaulus viviparus]|uniref:Uncharacterized protein n=1 Tax=Dictyocaulus viviparus TaxID=29172 RepID=A0A0D8XB60_DICVI|nr:hypothetical protein DICVIV_13148 [Dictyocaulus viviparus]
MAVFVQLRRMTVRMYEQKFFESTITEDESGEYSTNLTNLCVDSPFQRYWKKNTTCSRSNAVVYVIDRHRFEEDESATKSSSSVISKKL